MGLNIYLTLRCNNCPCPGKLSIRVAVDKDGHLQYSAAKTKLLNMTEALGWVLIETSEGSHYVCQECKEMIGIS